MATKKTHTETTPKVITGYKGFDKDFKCREKQYEVGKEYTEEEAQICNKGLHFCEYPMDIFSYYPPGTSRYASVEGSGNTDKESGGDSKVACTQLKIGAEITLKSLIEAGIKFTFDRVKWTKEGTTNKDGEGATSNGYKSGATSNGDNSGATSNGYKSGATSNGDNSGATSNGNYSGATSIGNNAKSSTVKGGVATAIGVGAKASGKIGAWLVITEAECDDNGLFTIIDLQSTLVDGKKIKEDIIYKLVGGKFVETE